MGRARPRDAAAEPLPAAPVARAWWQHYGDGRARGPRRPAGRPARRGRSTRRPLAAWVFAWRVSSAAGSPHWPTCSSLRRAEPSVAKALADRIRRLGRRHSRSLRAPAQQPARGGARAFARGDRARRGAGARPRPRLGNRLPGEDVVEEAEPPPAPPPPARRARTSRGSGRPQPEELRHALEDAFRLHATALGRAAGRLGVRHAARAALPPERRAPLAELDVPRIVLLRLDGRAIAFHYYFAFEGRMYVHRLAFDPAFARYSPGLVNTLDTIEAAAARRSEARRVPRRRRALQGRAGRRVRAAVPWPGNGARAQGPCARQGSARDHQASSQAQGVAAHSASCTSTGSLPFRRIAARPRDALRS